MLKLEKYRSYISGLRAHFPDLCLFKNRDVDNPVVDADGNVVSPDIVPDNDDQGLPLSELLGICGCGQTHKVARQFLSVMRRCRRYSEPKRDGEYFSGSGDYYRDLSDLMALYWLDQMGMTEHGSSIYGSFLTEKGELVEDLLTEWESEMDSGGAVEDEKDGK